MLRNIFRNFNKGRSLSNTKNNTYIIVSFFAFVLGILLFTFYTPNYFNERGPVVFDITRGSTLSSVIDSLYKKELLPSKTNMHIAAFLYGAENKIKAGRFEIPNGLSYLELLDLLLEGHHQEQKLITISEGIWQHNLAKLLKEEINIDSLEFVSLSRDKSYLRNLNLYVDNLEGYLLPETYYLYANSSADEVIKKLKNEMDKFWERSMIERLNNLGLTRHEILTMASIIDGESNLREEFARIAGVYHNRLKRRIKLQADPTIQYLIRNRRRNNKIYYKDLEIDSPYNTYKYYGLPPGPINNPGKDAIIAALFPEEHNYYYFVANGNGGHTFAKSFSEHQRNVRKYRQWRRNQ
jgi:UPF0755 protein